MESISYSVDYASIIVYDSNFSTVYRGHVSGDFFCSAKKYKSLIALACLIAQVLTHWALAIWLV
ncbi:hypothetical protein [Alphabaculovirus myunipunctae]|uniref:Uncharacterized protein n=1 Tax=Mythimna unipuncta nucleopolyhedrovirus TaxID=447897 RepID=A0A2K9VS36_9ABAC|nr:hypothetical protein [Mythimna unipuncta nucleopolyhedrovirus]AUV65266.1 hypothetical protein [Mythimna unipuncta nucleopolyhedrovirus]